MRPVPPDVSAHRRHLFSGLGAMTAALVIVPADPAAGPSVSAHSGRASRVATVGPRVVPSGSPWMVRLSMGMRGPDASARLAPGQEAPPGAPPATSPDPSRGAPRHV